ncbi:MAG: site-specific DNA-methyltransferase, partial [Spirochaetales bacterium]|nr:site-specific DNA-methyltransferase [Spirochaetales bacterium]
MQQARFRWHFSGGSSMKEVSAESAALVVTSPPYPMIAMWDEMFSSQSAAAAAALAADDGNKAFDAMHAVRDLVWQECARILMPGGFACVNIGDAVRSMGGGFRLYPNHARIIETFRNLGFDALPEIIWRKQTNAPNKFMGSGMLAAGAYVTLEHEFILIFRKGAKREFSARDKDLRRAGACFWEERNQWYSDLWDFKGIRQAAAGKQGRSRTAAFPFELARRLILMYSLPGDLVVDPFLGTGTTGLACLATGRDCAGCEIDPR